MNYIDKVRDVVSQIKYRTPILLIGDAVTIFKKMYSGPIKSVYTPDDVRDVVSYYHGIQDLSHPLIIEDLSSLSASSSFLLLKLVEEAKFPIILLSSYDKVSPIILSRCRAIVKFSIAEVTCQFLPAYKGKEAMDEYLSEDSEKMDQLRWMRDNSPMLYYYKMRLGDKTAVDKMLNILM